VSSRLSDATLDQLFRTARTASGWTNAPVTEEQLHELYDLMKWGPTSSNCCPARFVWVRSPGAKERLASCVWSPNKPKVMSAPVTVIVAHDHEFAPTMPQLFPARGEQFKTMYSEPSLAQVTAFRNGTLQGAYLMLAARALGLDCGPMSGFDHAAVDAEFFPDSSIRSNFICALGYGSRENLLPRNPRLTFEEAGHFA
jgi:3-hydroxypropanoate dehydrogenase